eukprot:TRINITY_DN30252_c0_g1_i2.p2 TRINITY_DN30252_c0_g1~~TRINITY_DN30252_c0_g1_i2.p2  ORF type:complete len:241 (-),score=29.61 TRINITY_DN30252_c0_g1_i2:107-829(-)
MSWLRMLARLVATVLATLVVSAVAVPPCGALGGCSFIHAMAADGSLTVLEAAPARWNAWLPRPCPVGAGWRCPCPAPPPGPLELLASADGPLALAVPFGGAGLGLGWACEGDGGAVPPAPRGGRGAVLLVRRGGCAFSLKVAAAAAAGYCAVIVANFRAGAPHPYYGLAELPDMTAEPPGGSDESMPIPAWLISRAAGDILEAAAAAGGAVHVSVRDEPRKPALGNRQSDAFGIRDHHSE